jgi:two-component system NtrC family sensor kinase
MTRGAGTAGRAVKKPSRKAARSHRAPKTARRSTSAIPSIDDLKEQLDEALAHQAATAEVLRVISSSQGELQPIFETILGNATRNCEAKFGTLFLYDGNAFQFAAHVGAPQEYVDFQTRRGPFQATPGSQIDQVLRTKRVKHTPNYAEAGITAIVKLAGARTFLSVPMLKDDELIGVINIYRREILPFSEKQIELVQNFAAQAVIAIENARLFEAEQHRARELSESLEQQAATLEVLKVIASSTGDLVPVFSALLANAARLCEASYGALWLRESGGFRTAALHGDLPQPYIDQWRSRVLFMPRPEVALARVAATGQPVQVEDLRNDASYLNRDPLPVAGVEVAGIRTLLVVPMFKDKELVGAIAIYRKEVRPFTEKQIELLANFAAQAVIAIENTRLFKELSDSLQQQTATADVLKVISRSTFDLERILQSLIDSAARLCRAEKAAIFRLDQGIYQFAAGYSLDAEFLEIEKVTPVVPGPGTIVGRAAMTRRVAQIDDVLADPQYEQKDKAKVGGIRSAIGVPLMREGEPIGVIALARSRVEPFNEREIELVTTFADQAVIAIENVRLFESVEARTRELAQSLEHLRTTQDRLVQTQKLASLGQLTAGIAHEIKNPLNFVNNFSGVSVELIDELQETLGQIKADDKTLAEISELTNTLRGNLDKVVQHGKRADAIVKNMLLHSRQGSAEHRPVDINALVEESLNLAYHGARAETQGFNITLERSLDPATGEADVFPQDITRVLLNLISNGFYAATRRKAEGNGGDGYEPTLAAATRNLGDSVEIRIRDNGTGIPPDVKEKMFNPFYTTKPAGEGTGLGLSISHDIIVKQHGGSIEVDTQPGEFTEIKITLPRSGAFPSEPAVHA